MESENWLSGVDILIEGNTIYSFQEEWFNERKHIYIKIRTRGKKLSLNRATTGFFSFWYFNIFFTILTCTSLYVYFYIILFNWNDLVNKYFRWPILTSVKLTIPCLKYLGKRKLF